MAKVISGKDLSAQLKDEMKAQVAAFPEKYGRVPHLVVILVGEDPGSVSYVTGKAKASESLGFLLQRFQLFLLFFNSSFCIS